MVQTILVKDASRHRTLVWLWLLTATVAVAAAGCGGCGKKEAKKPAPKPLANTAAKVDDARAKMYADGEDDESAAKPAGKEPAGKEPAGKEPAGKEPAGKKPGDKESAATSPKPEEKPPEKPPLPENVADWKTEEYYRARAENDPRLVEAVKYLGAHFAGTKGAEAAAQLLANLLKPSAAEPEPAAGVPGKAAKPVRVANRSTNSSSSLIAAVAEALAVNGSPVARGLLEQMVAGVFESEDDKATAEAALDSLATHPCPENEDVFFRLLTAPTKVRPAGQGKLSAEELQKKALALLPVVATERLRRKLAERAIDPTTPETLQTQLLKCLEEPHPDNLAAQLFLDQQAATPAKTRETLEAYFLASSSRSLATLLKVPEEVQSGRLPARRPAASPRSRAGKVEDDAEREAELPYLMARQLWAPSFTSAIEARLQKAESLDQDADTIALAATVPTDAMRLALFKTLRRYRQEGPKSLLAAGLADKLVGDPGFLAVVKMMPRKEPVAGTVRSGSSSRSRPQRSATGGKVSPQQAEEEWMLASEELAQTLCRRFLASAQAQAEAARKAGQVLDTKAAAARRPIELHPEAHVVAEYHLDWPEGLEGKEKLVGVPLDKMTIHYLRIEEKAKPQALHGYYRRKLDSVQTHALAEGAWLESFRTASHTDRKRSVDMLFTLAKDARGRGASARGEAEKSSDAEIDLVIELLAVEIEDPEVAAGQ